MSDHSSLAQERLRARARRIARLRKRVAAAALATFVLAFGAIAYDGSTGTTSASTTPATAPGTGSSSSTGSNWSTDNSGTSPMTTRQS
jgi:hypothetical protein